MSTRPRVPHPPGAAAALLPGALLLLLLLAPAPSRPLAAQEAGTAASAADLILERVEDAEGARFWTLVARLEALGKEAIPALERAVGASGERTRLAAARALIQLGDAEARTRSEAALRNLAAGARSKEVRAAAIEVLGAEGDPDEVQPLLEAMLEASIDPVIVIPLARALWEIDRVAAARDRLVELLGSKDLEVKHEAALALAEIDYFDGEVRNVLRALKREPTDRGRRAGDLDRIIGMSRQLDRGLEKGELFLEGADLSKLLKIKEERVRELEERLARAGTSSGAPRTAADAVLEEVVLQIQKSYVDEARTERKDLILGALKGMVRSLDEFSSFMDVEETEAFRESISGGYDGIGAQVHKAEGEPLEILRPIYSGPAYRAGILSGDRVIEVDGARTGDLPFEDVTDKLKGPPGSTVTLKVVRRGWEEPKEFVIERGTVEVPSVHTETLPGKIGYLLLQQFGDRSADEFIAGLDALEKEGLAGLIIDLRNNPGGRLDVAVRITDQFVAGEMPIVTQKGRGRQRGGEEIVTPADPFTRSNYPIVVLVNQRSASASEVLAGALQDFARATLVGQRTFGKGSVQRLIPLSSEAQRVLGGKGQLRLTVQYYFLPLGRCIHTIRDTSGAVVEQGGVLPDIEVEADRIPAWRAEEKERLRTHPAVLDYVEKHWSDIAHLFADGDDHDPAKYPGFDELQKALETPAPREDVRSVLRFHIRRRLEDARGREFACDFQEDTQLQRAILEILEKMGERPEDHPRYASLAAKAEGTKR